MLYLVVYDFSNIVFIIVLYLVVIFYFNNRVHMSLESDSYDLVYIMLFVLINIS